jgi:hypothetical protein
MRPFSEWQAGMVLRSAEEPAALEASFSDWLTERLNSEEHAMVAELHGAWQRRSKNLQVALCQAFTDSLHTNGGMRLPPSIEGRLPITPETPQLTQPVVKGSPMAQKLDPNLTPKHTPMMYGKVSPPIVDGPPRAPPIPDEATPLTRGRFASPAGIINELDTRSSVSSKFTTRGPETSTGSRHWHRLEVIFGAIILLNAFVMLAEAQYQGYDAGFALRIRGFDKSGKDTFPAAEGMFDVLNVLFNIMFTLELVCRLHHAKLQFYRSPWIWLDLIVVPYAWFDILDVFGASAPASAMVRIFRVGRLFHLIETMQSFEKLDQMVRSIKASFGALIWCMILIVFTQVVAALWLNYTLSGFYQDSSKPESVRVEIFKYFGTSSRMLLTMFQVVFANWTQPCWMLVLNVNEWYGLFFVLYRCVLGFALIKVVSSMFIAETHKICDHDKEVTHLMKKRDGHLIKKQLRDMFSEVDGSGDGTVSWQELNVMLESKKLLRWLEKMNINPLHLVELFKVLQKGGSSPEESYVDLDEFMSALLKVDGPAKSIDVLALHKAVEKLDRINNIFESRQMMQQGGPFESLLRQGSPTEVPTLKLLTVK